MTVFARATDVSTNKAKQQQYSAPNVLSTDSSFGPGLYESELFGHVLSDVSHAAFC
jgi:hypothetical protein